MKKIIRFSLCDVIVPRELDPLQCVFFELIPWVYIYVECTTQAHLREDQDWVSLCIKTALESWDPIRCGGLLLVNTIMLIITCDDMFNPTDVAQHGHRLSEVSQHVTFGHCETRGQYRHTWLIFFKLIIFDEQLQWFVNLTHGRADGWAQGPLAWIERDAQPQPSFINR